MSTACGLTAEGEEILAAARKMEAASFRSRARARSCGDRPCRGEVKLAITEGLGTFWLAPRLVEFQRTHPKLLVDLNCAMRSADVLRLEADAAVQLTKPTAPDLKVVKLGRLHSMPFAAPSVYRDVWRPEDASKSCSITGSCCKLRIRLARKSFMTVFFRAFRKPGWSRFRTNVSSAHVWAIIKGRRHWLVCRPISHAIGARSRADRSRSGLLSSISGCLSCRRSTNSACAPDDRLGHRLVRPKDFPWFRDEFIHPNDLADGVSRRAAGQPVRGISRGKQNAPFDASRRASAAAEADAV